MAGGTVIGCLVVCFAFARVHRWFVNRRNRKIAARLRESKRLRSEISGYPLVSKPTDESSLSEKEVDPQVMAKRLRETIDGVHARLNVRTGAYLAFNTTALGILGGFKPMPAWSVALTLAVILVNFLGFTTNHSYVTDLHIMHLKHDDIAPDDPATRALKDAGVKAGGLSPTIAFALYLPVIVIIGWFVFLVSIWPY